MSTRAVLAILRRIALVAMEALAIWYVLAYFPLPVLHFVYELY